MTAFPYVIHSGLEPETYCLAYQLLLSQLRLSRICGLDHIFAVSGVVRMASTEPPNNHSLN
ncbi:MAG: hypothetical protein WBA23_00565 [Tunicatimonas sp.]|uniref:hypothetical protein n=1 Tax=Tunicatimonas sp. TaxID=1940096 RepID=UPI003C735380